METYVITEYTDVIYAGNDMEKAEQIYNEDKRNGDVDVWVDGVKVRHTLKEPNRDE